MELMGTGTALITPFRADGSVDESALHALVHWQIESGISFLVPCGSTGEASTLSEEETVAVVTMVAATAAGRVPVIAGCTHNSTAEAVRRVERLSQIRGLDGILTANPYYSKPSQEGQYQHFKAIAEASNLPVLLYNIPGRTAANLEPSTVLRLAELKNIIGIKESSGNLLQITELLTRAPRTFRVFSGDDGFALPTLAVGASGLISVASNVIPEPVTHMVASALQNDWPTARRINRQFFGFMQALFLEPNPAPAKAVLSLMGKIDGDYLRLPMTPVTFALRRRLETIVGELGLLVEAPQGSDPHRMY